MNIIWRIAGVALVASLALFIISLLVKVLLIVSATALVIGAVGRKLMGRRFGQLGQGNWRSSEIISIDNPTYYPMERQRAYGRIIPIS
ncbi:hypothetical protein [Spirosoma koreense]